MRCARERYFERMELVTTCASCGSEAADEDRFCGACGAAIAPEVATPDPNDHAELVISKDFAGVTDRGKRHVRNEDALLIAETPTPSGLLRLLVVSEGARHLAAVDLDSGEVRWRHAARRGGVFRVRRAGKLLLVACGETSLSALDVTTGEVVWLASCGLKLAAIRSAHCAGKLGAGLNRPR